MPNEGEWTKICAACAEGTPPECCAYYGEPNGCNAPKLGQHPDGNVAERLQGELEKAERRIAELERAPGNVAAMREALEWVAQFAELGVDDELGADGQNILTAAEMARAALAAPARNCDRFATVDDAREAFQEARGHKVFADVELWDSVDEAGAFVRWLLAPAKEVGRTRREAEVDRRENRPGKVRFRRVAVFSRQIRRDHLDGAREEGRRGMSSEIVKTGTIGGRGFCVVQRSDANPWPMCLGEQFQLFGHKIIGRGWLCGYVDATGSRFDGIDDEDDPAFAGLGVEITYTGQGVPNCEGAPSTGWWIGFDTAHPGMEGETPESVEEAIRRLVREIDEVRT